MRALPLVGWSRSSRVRIVVVLPAPLGPRKPKTSPGSTSIVTSSMPACAAVELGQPLGLDRRRTHPPQANRATAAAPSAKDRTIASVAPGWEGPLRRLRSSAMKLSAEDEWLSHFVMQRAMLLGIKARAEAGSGA